MAKQFNAYMREQPQVLAAIAADGEQIAKPALTFCGNGRPERVFLLGSGSSYNAACACAGTVQMLLGVEVSCLTPTVLGELPQLSDGPIIALSQSGTSTSTLEAVRKLQRDGRKVLAITAEPNSPVGRQADAYVPVECGPEKVGPKTKGATATMMTLLVCVLALARKFGSAAEPVLTAAQRELADIPAQVASAIESGGQFYARNRERIAAAQLMMLVADAKGYGASQECALKLLETCWLPVFPYEFEEFMHGIHYSVGTGSNLFFLLPRDGTERARMLRLAAFSAKHGANIYVLDTYQGKDDSFLITSAGAITRPFALIAFFQALCGPLSQDRGINCDVPRYADFGQSMETKLIQ